MYHPLMELQDGSKVVGGGADKAARMMDLQSQQTTQVAAHDEPIKSVRMFTTGGNTMLATGSWDKTVKYWDLRQQNPVGTLTCQDRVYTMDIKDQLLVVGTADRYINIVNLSDPLKFYKTMQSPLKWQTRVVSCFIDASGFAVGSIEGRCAMQYVEEKDASLNFSFKCHRQPDSADRNVAKVYAVNDISWHPQHGTFSTAGSDGTYHFWDKDAKHRLKNYPEVGGAIVSTSFNRTGNIFAYAVSYDWSKGFAAHTANYPNKIMLHPIQGDECKPRPGAKKR
jgi:mRNA export factor